MTIDITDHRPDHLAQSNALMKWYHLFRLPLVQLWLRRFGEYCPPSNSFWKATVVTQSLYKEKKGKGQKDGEIARWFRNLRSHPEEGNIENGITLWILLSLSLNLFQITCPCWITSSSHVLARATCLIPEIMRTLWLELLLSAMHF